MFPRPCGRCRLCVCDAGRIFANRSCAAQWPLWLHRGFCAVQDSQDFMPFNIKQCCDKRFQFAGVHAFVPFHVFHLLQWVCCLFHFRHHAPDAVPFGPDRTSVQPCMIRLAGRPVPACRKRPARSAPGALTCPRPVPPSAAPPGHAHCVTHTRLPRGAQGAIILLRPRPHKP